MRSVCSSSTSMRTPSPLSTLPITWTSEMLGTLVSVRRARREQRRRHELQRGVLRPGDLDGPLEGMPAMDADDVHKAAFHNHARNRCGPGHGTFAFTRGVSSALLQAQQLAPCDFIIEICAACIICGQIAQLFFKSAQALAHLVGRHRGHILGAFGQDNHLVARDPRRSRHPRRKVRVTSPIRSSHRRTYPEATEQISLAWSGATPSSPSVVGSATNTASPSYALCSGHTMRTRMATRSPSSSQRARARRRWCRRKRNACSGMSSHSPSTMAAKLRTVSSTRMYTPGLPRELLGHMERPARGNCCSLRARSTVRRCSSESSSMPRDGDDVLQVGVLLQDLLHLHRHAVVLLAHDARVERVGARCERGRWPGKRPSAAMERERHRLGVEVG